ncbi:MAG: LPXTG cell wall anchor domain-containing protein [Candidatus Paceibacterota bacterium]
MKNIKTKTVLSTIVFFLLMGLNGVANAADPFLSVSPSSITKNAGSVFNVQVGIDPQDNKVCAVEGIVSFNNMACQGITLASDLIAQTTPTCSNPYYLIGIPGCTLSNRNLLTVSVNVGRAASASINNTSVDIIGEGISLGSSSIGGNYTVNNVPVIEVIPAPIEIIEPEPEALEPIQTPTEPNLPRETINPEQANLASTSSSLVNYLWIGLLIIILGLGVYYFIRKRRK